MKKEIMIKSILKGKYKRILSSLYSGKFYLWFPLGIGFILRAHGLEQNSVWYDEALTIFLTRLPLFPMIRLISFELNPPLWEILEKVVVLIFPQQAWGYRILSFLFSIGILWVGEQILAFYKVQKSLRFMTLLLLGLLPYQIWMAQDARVYALMSYLYLQGFLFILQKNFWGFLACSGLLLYSNSAAPFYVMTLFIIAFLNHPHEWRKIFYTGFGAILSFFPWIFIWGKALEGRFFSGINVPEVNGERLFFQLSHVFWIDNMSLLNFILSISGLIFLIVIFLSFFLLGIIQKASHLRLLFVPGLLCVFPILMIFIAGMFYHSGHLIVYRSLSGISAVTILFLAYLLNEYKITGKIILGVLIALSVLYLLFWSPNQKGGYLKEKLENLKPEIQSGDIFYHATATTLLPFAFYLDGHSHYLLDEKFPPGFMIPPFQEAFNLQKVPLEKLENQRVWIIYSNDSQLSPHIHQRMNFYIRSANYYGKIEYPQAAPVNIYLLER